MVNVTSMDSKKGFTIVELLIVIVVIGILAAITIVAYNGIQRKAQDAKIQSSVGSMRKKFGVVNVSAGSADIYGKIAKPATKQQVLTYYDAATMSNDLVVCADQYKDSQCVSGSGYVKDKVYLISGCNGLWLSYWLNADKLWHISQTYPNMDTYNYTDGSSPQTDADCY